MGGGVTIYIYIYITGNTQGIGYNFEGIGLGIGIFRGIVLYPWIPFKTYIFFVPLKTIWSLP